MYLIIIGNGYDDDDTLYILYDKDFWINVWMNDREDSSQSHRTNQNILNLNPLSLVESWPGPYKLR